MSSKHVSKLVIQVHSARKGLREKEKEELDEIKEMKKEYRTTEENPYIIIQTMA